MLTYFLTFFSSCKQKSGTTCFGREEVYDKDDRLFVNSQIRNEKNNTETILKKYFEVKKGFKLDLGLLFLFNNFTQAFQIVFKLL